MHRLQSFSTFAMNLLFRNLTFRWPCMVINSYNKTNQMHQFLKFIFGIKLYIFRTVPLAIIRSFSLYTHQWYMSYRFADSLRAGSGRNSVPSRSCSLPVSKPVRHIPLLRVQWKTPDDGQRNCPKHVEFYSKNKFEKLVHLVGFISRNVTWALHCKLLRLCTFDLYPYYTTSTSQRVEIKLYPLSIEEAGHAIKYTLYRKAKQ